LNRNLTTTLGQHLNQLINRKPIDRSRIRRFSASAGAKAKSANTLFEPWVISMDAEFMVVGSGSVEIACTGTVFQE
jgi:hypothetical protein